MTTICFSLYNKSSAIILQNNGTIQIRMINSLLGLVNFLSKWRVFYFIFVFALKEKFEDTKMGYQKS